MKDKKSVDFLVKILYNINRKVEEIFSPYG